MQIILRQCAKNIIYFKQALKLKSNKNKSNKLVGGQQRWLCFKIRICRHLDCRSCPKRYQCSLDRACIKEQPAENLFACQTECTHKIQTTTSTCTTTTTVKDFFWDYERTNERMDNKKGQHAFAPDRQKSGERERVVVSGVRERSCPSGTSWMNWIEGEGVGVRTEEEEAKEEEEDWGREREKERKKERERAWFSFLATSWIQSERLLLMLLLQVMQKT